MDILETAPFRAPAGKNKMCWAEPVPLHSTGVWNVNAANAFLGFALPRLLSQLAVIFLLTQSLHALLYRIHLPRIVSEILAGLILGPTIIGHLIPNFSTKLFPPEGDAFLNILAKIGFMLFMFLSGVKMDLSMVKKSGKNAWTIGVVSVLLPLLINITVSPLIAQRMTLTKTSTLLAVVWTQMLSPFPVIARLLVDLQIINSELGHLALAAALIRELFSLLSSTCINSQRVGALGSTALAVQSGTLILVLVSSLAFLTRVIFSWIIKGTREGKPVKGIYVSFISVGVLVSAIVADNLGILYYYGPYLLGLAVPDGQPLGSTLTERLDTMVLGLFVPLLSTYTGLHSDLFKIHDLEFGKILLSVLCGSVVVKFMGNFIPALFRKLPFRDSVALSLVLSAQGVVELASSVAYSENETFDEQTFSTMTLSILLSASIIPLLVRLIYDGSNRYKGYQQRNILHSNNGELRIVACVHRPDDALSIIKLLKSNNPTEESPVTIFALHLVELVGRSSPLLINHQLGQRSSSRSGSSQSQQIIDLFDSYEKEHLGFVTAQAFTAISLFRFVHEDVCSLAFEKSASLIILPFHRKWNSQGKVILDSDALRSINRHVLNLAPCSVGILIDRRRVHQPQPSVNPDQEESAHRVAALFLGGNDDLEAVAYAKRMAVSSHTQLTIVQFLMNEDEGDQNSEHGLESEVMKDLELTSSEKINIQVVEEKVRDGAELALIVHSMEEVYDLIIVGRRHSLDSPLLSGLTEWVELPELGPLGDMLAAQDISRPISVMVVQQQLHMTDK